MNFSYTQISQFLYCPRRYRYRYLDGWREKDTRAAMLFGRTFEQALAAHFLDEDGTEVFFNEWSGYRNSTIEYSRGDNWQSMLKAGMELLKQFIQEGRVRVPHPRRNLQVKILRPLPGGDSFISYVDAIGQCDDTPCLLDWKTSSSCYPLTPAGLYQLDPQLLCYSWMTGMESVALIVFVRKRLPEIQYLRATINERQRQEYGQLVEETVRRIHPARFSQHSGIRFPQNGCLSCPYLGLCLNKPENGATQADARTRGRP